MSTTGPTDRELIKAGRDVTQDTERRNDLIRRAHTAGRGVREIGRLVGLSHAAVINIITPRKRP